MDWQRWDDAAEINDFVSVEYQEMAAESQSCENQELAKSDVACQSDSPTGQTQTSSCMS